MLRELPVFIQTPVCTFETLFWKSPSCFSPFLRKCNLHFPQISLWQTLEHLAFRKTHPLKDQKVPSTYLFTGTMTSCVTSKGAIMGVTLARAMPPRLRTLPTAMSKVAGDSIKVTSWENKLTGKVKVNLLHMLITTYFVGFFFFFFFSPNVLGLCCDTRLSLDAACGGFSSCSTLAPEFTGSVAKAHRLNCLETSEILVPQTGIEPKSPALEGGSSTTEALTYRSPCSLFLREEITHLIFPKSL